MNGVVGWQCKFLQLKKLLLSFGADFLAIKGDVESEIDGSWLFNGDDGSKWFHVGTTDE